MAIIVLGISVYSFDNNEMVASVPMTSTPLLHKRRSIPGAAIAATLSDSPVQSQAPNLNQEKSDQARLDPATASVRNDDQIPQKRNDPGMGVVSPTIGPSPIGKANRQNLL